MNNSAMKEQKKNGFYVALAAPGILWMLLLFIVPFYAVLAICTPRSSRPSGYPC